jgi:iron complex outermembrane receptor protein
MKYRHTRLKALLLCGAAPFISHPAFAQDATDASSAADDVFIEEVIVTGSLIRRDSTARAPLEVVDREDFNLQGASNVIDIARNLTVNSGSVLVQDTGTLVGTAQINLRGLGLGSTLTLINGRRAGIAPIADGGGNDFFDVNQLPLAMIERIDFLKDGASTTYGSQAVAGVANIITRKGFEGLELSARYEDSTNDAYSINLAAGGALNDRGHINVYATYYGQARGDRSDYDFLIERLGGSLQGVDPSPSSSGPLTSSTGQPGSYTAAVTDPVTGVISPVSGSTLPDPNCEAAGGILVGARCRHDFFDQVSVIQDEERYQVFTEGDYSLTENLTVFWEGHFSRNRVKRTSGPGLFQNGLVETGAILVPGDHPFNFFVADDTAASGLRYVDPANWDPATDSAVDIVCLCRPLGAGLNGMDNADPRKLSIDYWRGLGGVTFNIDDNWTAEASYQYSSARRGETVSFNFIADSINQAALDGTWNPFGSSLATPTLVSPKDGVSVAGNSQEVLSSLYTTEQNEYLSDQYTVDGVVTGDLFDLPAGPVGVAVGAQYRVESFQFTPDALAAAARAESRNPVFPAEGEQDVKSIFTEAVVPLLDNLEVQVALRYEDYGDQGGSTTDPKIAARWDATDWFALRGSWGTSFQAPTIRQLSKASSRDLFDDAAVVDPATGALTCGSGGTTISGELLLSGSDDLGPQTARNFNLGAIFTPARGLSVVVDYWNFDYKDLISPDEGAQAIIDSECATGTFVADPRVERDSGGNIRRVNTFFVNTARVKTDGLDFGVDYGFALSDAMDAALSAQASWINKFKYQAQAGDDFEDVVGSRNSRNPFRSLPEWRFNVGGRLATGPHQIAATVRYIDGYVNDANDEQVRSHTTLDVQYSLSLEEFFDGKPTQFSIGANNVFDRDPPSLGFRDRPGFDDTVHDIRGRIVYVAISQQF